MLYRFRLQTLLVVFTAIALWLGSNLAAYRLFGHLSQQLMVTYVLSRLPFYLVCVVGAAIVFSRRHNCPVPSRLALAGIGIALASQILAPLGAILAMYVLAWFRAARWVMVSQALIAAGIEATSWGLLIAAFVRATSIEKREIRENSI